MENALQFDMPRETKSIIKVIGVGGGGSNAVNYMYEQGINGVDFIVCNTDAQALEQSPVPLKVQLGSTLTEGRGAGSIPEVGRNAAIESLEEVRAMLSGNTNMVFITAGMGGGTGTGAAPVIARLAKDMGILTVGIVTVPFVFEGKKRSVQADFGVKEIRDSVDTLLIIRNDKLRELFGNLTLKQAFSHADEVLCIAAKGIAEVITLTGTVNVDMNDVKTVMRNSGRAIMGSGRASGEGRAKRAVLTALESPLLNDNDINGANFILLNITFGSDELLMDEISEITDHIQQQAGSAAEVIWGYGQDSTLGEDICVTVIATGFNPKAVDNTFPSFQPEFIKLPLDAESPREVTEKVESPTSGLADETKWTDTNSSEPFIRNKEIEFEIRNTVSETPPVTGIPTLFSQEDIPSFSSVRHKADDITTPIEGQIRFNTGAGNLKDQPAATSSNQAPDHLPIKEESRLADRPTRSEMVARNKEREGRIRDFTQKLKTPSGLTEMESEPAYMRRKVALDQAQLSNESSVSRYTLNESTDDQGEKKTELRDNNPFLHDNVD